jgi:hypothetical protein
VRWPERGALPGLVGAEEAAGGLVIGCRVGGLGLLGQPASTAAATSAVAARIRNQGRRAGKRTREWDFTGLPSAGGIAREREVVNHTNAVSPRNAPRRGAAGGKRGVRNRKIRWSCGSTPARRSALQDPTTGRPPRMAAGFIPFVFILIVASSLPADFLLADAPHPADRRTPPSSLPLGPLPSFIIHHSSLAVLVLTTGPSRGILQW